MSIWTDASDLLPGLKPGAFRGIPFFIPDISHAVGRRIVLTWFPGKDAPAADDLGRSDGRITVRGLVLGDDYVARALALQGAFQQAGPGTLLHPWLGEMRVVVPEDGAQISFRSTELRMVSVDVTFMPVPQGVAFAGSSLSALLSSASGLLSAASAFGTSALSGLAVAVGTWSSAMTTALGMGTVVSSLVAASSASASLELRIEASQATLSTATTAGAGATSAVAVAAALTALATPVADAAIGTPTAAIGVGGTASAPVAALTARAGTTLLLQMVDAMRATAALGAPAAGVRLTAQLATLSEAARVAAEIDHESRQEAQSWHDALDAALDTAADDVATMAESMPAEVAPLWGAVAELRGALARDLNEIIGRLPAVRQVTPAGTVSAWIIATALKGDDPSAIVPMLDDIVARNRLRQPGAVPPEPLEILL